VKLAELPAVLALSADEKLELLDELLLSVAREIGSDISEEEKRLLESRWAEHLANPEKALTLEQFNEALDERLK
jgi:putative addiction module component (TIGR02574 family)